MTDGQLPLVGVELGDSVLTAVELFLYLSASIDILLT